MSATPWEDAYRASMQALGLPADEHSHAMALARMYDRDGVPAVKPMPGYEPRSQFLRAMYRAQHELTCCDDASRESTGTRVDRSRSSPADSAGTPA